LFAGESGTVAWTVTGKEFSYLKTDLTVGFNFISWPFSTSNDAKVLLDKVKVGGTSSNTFWSYLRNLFTPSGAAISGPQNNPSSTYNTGDITLQPGSAYIVNVSAAFDIDNGTTLSSDELKRQQIKALVPILTISDIINDMIIIDISTSSTPDILINDVNESNNRISRKYFVEELFVKNKSFFEGAGQGTKLLMSTSSFLGTSQIITNNYVRIL